MSRSAGARRGGASVGAPEVERLATLARLSLSEREADRLGADLSSILDYFATLDSVDVTGIEPPAASTDDRSGARDDVASPSSPDELLDGVPRKRGRLVRAPRVF